MCLSIGVALRLLLCSCAIALLLSTSTLYVVAWYEPGLPSAGELCFWHWHGALSAMVHIPRPCLLYHAQQRKQLEVSELSLL